MVHGMVQFPSIGCVVEFMQGNSPQIAWVLEENNGKLRLLLPNRREMNVPQNRLLPWSGPVYSGISSRDGAVELLTKHKESREALKNAIRVDDFWDMAQGELARAPASWFAELSQSDPDIDAVAACGHALMECKSHFKFQPPTFEVYPEETVQARLAEQEALRIREELAQQGHAWMAHLWDCHTRREGYTKKVSALSPEVESQLRALLLRRIVEPESTADDTQWRLLIKGLPDEPFLPLHLAEAWGLVPAHYNYLMDRADYAPGDAWAGEYCAAVTELTEQISAASLVENNTPFISIDSATTRDIDDALHVSVHPDGGWTVSIALACPAFCWPFGSPLDKAVHQRATSIYLPEATHHMLPEQLGTDVYTLKEQTLRPALVVQCHVDTEGEVHNFAPSLARVRVKHNTTYEAVEAALCGAEDSSHAEMLQAALAVAEAYQARRLRNMAVSIKRPDPHFVLHTDETTHTTVALEDSPENPRAQLVVSELMVLVNAALARWAAEQGIALLHRTQNVTIPKEAAGIWEAPEDIARVVRVLPPATLEVTPRLHAGLGEPVYAPSTSPLRRYPDLLNEAQVLHVLEHGKARWTHDELEAMLPLLGMRLDAAGSVQRTRPRYWKLLYFLQFGSKHWWPGVVTDENDAFVSVSLPREQLFLRGKHSLFDERCHPGQPIEVRLHKINPLNNDIFIAETREPQ